MFILIVGVVVGDEELYDIFVEFFDFIIEEWYNGFKKMDMYKIDFDLFKICGGKFDECYVLFLCVCMGWLICGFSLLFYCLCVEWREVENIVCEVLDGFKGEFV